MPVYPHITVTLDPRPDAPTPRTQARVAMARAGVPESQLQKYDRQVMKAQSPSRVIAVILNWVGDVIC